MDTVYSTLAYIDAIHDFKGFAITHKDKIQIGLPGRILNIEAFISMTELEDTIADVFIGRSGTIENLVFTTPLKLHRNLCNGHESFGLVSDATGSNEILKILERGNRSYYIVQNREVLCDSAPTLKHSSITKGIIVNDNNGALVKYKKWSHGLYLSSKFCSNYEYIIEYENKNDINYSANGHTLSIHKSRTSDNPNNRDNIVDYIRGTSSDQDISIAFQRKRSGDWFQALSTLNTTRDYILPDGSPKKLNVPIYFCTADRVAATYAISVGVNTIFFQTTTGIHLIYKNNISLQMDAFSPDEHYMPSQSSEYKRGIAEGITAYDARKTEIFAALDALNPTNSHEIMKYIGYLYCYTYMHKMVGLQLGHHRSLAMEYIENVSTVENDADKMRTICSLYDTLMTYIPIITAHNIHSTVAFPSLPTVQPISTSGVVGPSEIYLAGLLNEFSRSRNIPTYIQKAIDCILRLSVASEPLRFHYEGVLRSDATNTITGGFIKPKRSRRSRKSRRNNTRFRNTLRNTWSQAQTTYRELVDTYVSYLKGRTRYNHAKQGEKGIYGCGDVSVCIENLEYLVATTGHFKEDIADYEAYCEDYERKEQERLQTPENIYYDERLVQLVLEAKRKNVEAI
jgi:hypothetical protein